MYDCGDILRDYWEKCVKERLIYARKFELYSIARPSQQ